MTVNEIHDDLEELVALDRIKLIERWTAVFGCPAPRNCQVTLLRNALAWNLQMTNLERSESADCNRILKQLQRSNATSLVSDSHAPGTRLLREWQGQTHHVTVLTRGFEYNGKPYRSLSAIARHITGTPWSGPQFFGLRT